MRRALCLLLALIVLASLFTGCRRGETKTLHCDRCGKAVTVNADSNMEEDWILYCKDCEKELGLDKLIP